MYCVERMLPKIGFIIRKNWSVLIFGIHFWDDARPASVFTRFSANPRPYCL